MTKVFNATLTTDVQTVSLIDCQETKVDVENVENVDSFQRVWLLVGHIQLLELKNVGKLVKIPPTKSSPTKHEPDLILI